MSEPGIESGPAVSNFGRPPTQRLGSPVKRTPNWISLEIPDGWFWKESFDLLAPEGNANIIASTEPLDPEITLDKFVQAQGDLLSTEFPGFHEFKLERARIRGVLEAMLREFAWNPPDGERVRQLQLYAVRDGRSITATGTTPESAWEANGEQLLGTMLSLLVEPR
jgi:hypothetical protein